MGVHMKTRVPIEGARHQVSCYFYVQGFRGCICGFSGLEMGWLCV